MKKTSGLSAELEAAVREIAREAGQRNNSALHYHFGSKEALIEAILHNGMAEVNALRNDYIDQLFNAGRHLELRALVEAIVWPLAARLVGGRGDTYNRFLAAAQGTLGFFFALVVLTRLTTFLPRSEAILRHSAAEDHRFPPRPDDRQ